MWPLIILIVLAIMFGAGALLGAPYLPILRRDYEPLLDLADVQAGQTIVDLGSGDGRFLRAAAARGATCIGYEINPLLYLISLAVTWRYRHHVTVHLRDFWHITLPPADVIYVFLIDRYMEKLHHKLQAEVTVPTHVVSFVFQIPDYPSTANNRNAWVYLYGHDATVKLAQPTALL